MATIRQQIVDKVVARFRGISKRAGFATDIGQRVFATRPVKPTAAETTRGVLNIWDLEQEHKVGPVSGVHEYLLTISVFLAYEGADAAEVIRTVLSDVAMAIGAGPTWDGLAVESTPLKDEYQLNQANDLTGDVRYQFKIRYRTKAWDHNTAA